MSGKRVLTGTHFMLGNHAVVEGALAAGCDFFAGYPITPANEISEHMAARMPQVGGEFLQSEDELCSIFSVTGAALAGAKAMTATASAGSEKSYNFAEVEQPQNPVEMELSHLITVKYEVCLIRLLNRKVYLSQHNLFLF